MRMHMQLASAGGPMNVRSQCSICHSLYIHR